jgi:putative membrane protein
MNGLARFCIHLIAIAVTLWLASRVFAGIRFSDTQTLIIAAVVLGFVNALVRPVLVLLTLPLTILTLGLFLLVLNALMLLLVARLVSGFTVADFLTAFLASIFISVVSYVIGGILRIGVKDA